MTWPDRRLMDLLGIEVPIVQAPMAGSQNWQLAAAVSQAGGLGSLPCAMLTPMQLRDEVERVRAHTDKPFNVNFFTHRPPEPNNAREAAWRDRLAPYYRELGIDPAAPVPSTNRAPFDATFCEIVVDVRPRVVSFHFGLPEPDLLRRVKNAGCIVLSTATTVAEARWLVEHGADAIIAQGYEAGGHRGMFLTEDVLAQPGTFALVPQVADAVEVPVIAAGGIADGRGIAAAFALGAAGVQIGTGYLFSPDSKISAIHRAALKSAHDDSTTLTNLISGRPARGIYNRLLREVGPMSDVAPAFPLASGALAPLRAKAEAAGSGEFSPLWAGQGVPLGREIGAFDLTRRLAEEALDRLGALGRG